MAKFKNYGYLGCMFERNRFLLTLPPADELAKTRNLLVSVDGRSSNKNVPLTQETYEFGAGMGCFVFIRILDQDGEGSSWVYETDFLLVPGEDIPEEAGIKVERID